VIGLVAALAFSSVDAAAVAALAECRAIDTRTECGGYVYKAADGYRYTAPIKSTQPNGIDLSGVYTLNWGWVADYHTHPCVGVRPLNEVFSPGDVASNAGLHLPGYMLSLCSGVVRRWAEGDAPDDFEIDYSSGRVVYCAIGHIVGFVEVTNARRAVRKN
jgi:hypothetical protein